MEASCGVLQIEIEKNEQIEIQDLFFKIVSKKWYLKIYNVPHYYPV